MREREGFGGPWNGEVRKSCSFGLLLMSLNFFLLWLPQIHRPSKGQGWRDDLSPIEFISSWSRLPPLPSFSPRRLGSDHLDVWAHPEAQLLLSLPPSSCCPRLSALLVPSYRLPSSHPACPVVYELVSAYSSPVLSPLLPPKKLKCQLRVGVREAVLESSIRPISAVLQIFTLSQR